MAILRRMGLPMVLFGVLAVVLLASMRTTPDTASIRRLITTTVNGTKVSLDIPPPGAELNPPSYDYTYDKMISMSAKNKITKDPCLDLALPGGGMEVRPGKGTKVLVTGGAGFIGSNLVDRLLSLGYKVRIFDNLYTGFIRNVPLENPDVEFVYGDILDPAALQRAVDGVDFVYHLAAMSKVVPSLKNSAMARFCTESNALGTWNVLDAARQQGGVRKVVYAGSSTYYGNKAPPHREEMAPDFLTPYAASKYEGEMQMNMFDRLFDVPTITTRFFMVYGPRQPSTGAYAIVTGVFAKQAAEGKSLTIEGDGTHYRDFIHVEDIVEGLILAQQKYDLRGDVINLGSGTAFSVNDVANLVSKDQIHVAERKNDLTGTLADTCKMKQMLGYKAKKDFKTEMAYMAKQTMEGNVFMQRWLTPTHALSAPHIIPIGDPMMKWPESDDLDALLLSLKHLEQQQLGGDGQQPIGKNMTVLSFNTTGENTEAMKDMLLNTVHSLVRYGEVKSYIVVASNDGDDDGMVACRSLNLPCYHAGDDGLAGLLSELLSAGYSVHLGHVGNSYIRPIGSSFAALGSATPNADVIGSASGGDVFIKSNDRTRAALAKWTDAQDGMPGRTNLAVLSALDSWAESAGVNKASASTSHICTSSSISGSADSSTEEGSLTKKTSCPPGTVFYVSADCSTADLNVAPSAAKKTLTELGAWHLSECFDKLHCDRQQQVPLRWVQSTPDLAPRGGLC